MIVLILHLLKAVDVRAHVLQLLIDLALSVVPAEVEGVYACVQVGILVEQLLGKNVVRG
jgi:hypothetical protein